MDRSGGLRRKPCRPAFFRESRAASICSSYSSKSHSEKALWQRIYTVQRRSSPTTVALIDFPIAVGKTLLPSNLGEHLNHPDTDRLFRECSNHPDTAPTMLGSRYRSQKIPRFPPEAEQANSVYIASTVHSIYVSLKEPLFGMSPGISGPIPMARWSRKIHGDLLELGAGRVFVRLTKHPARGSGPSSQ
jgi:hypothetical protein